MSQPEFRAGFARVNITPPMGISLAGHGNYNTRLAEGVIDDLEINTLAVSVGGNTAVLFSADLLYMRKVDSEPIRRAVAEAVGIPYEAIFIACTHTHTGATVSVDHVPDFVPNQVWHDYRAFLKTRFCDAAKFAIDDLKPARMGWAVGYAPGVSFVRRYRMADGTVRTNPGYKPGEVVEPVCEPDRRVNVLRFLREGGKEIAVANFGVHPDTIGAIRYISADYPRTVRETVEAVLPAHCIFFNGCQGDINHCDFMNSPKEYDEFHLENETAYARYRNYRLSKHTPTQHVGRTIAGALLQVYGNVKWVDVDNVSFGNKDYDAQFNKGTAEELVWAKEIVARHEAGDPLKELPKNTINKAQRIVNLDGGPDADTLPVSAIRIGPAVFVGLPGEPFNGIGEGLKANSPFEITLPCCLTNGGQGYLPMYDAYAEGGYEANSAKFRAGTAEGLIETGTELIRSLF